MYYVLCLGVAIICILGVSFLSSLVMRYIFGKPCTCGDMYHLYPCTLIKDKEESSMTMWREAEIYDKESGGWLRVGRGDVKIGDRFRLFEPDGTPVIDGNKNIAWVATSDSLPTEPEGNFMIKTEVI